MRITECKIFSHTVRCTPLGRATGPRHRTSLLVQLRDNDGTVGWGEACPLPGYSRDTLQTAHADLSVFRDRLPLSLAESDVTATLRSTHDALAQAGPATTFAIETAVLDLLGQRSAKPIHKLVGSDIVAPVSINAVLSADLDPLDAARKAVARGITTLKLKTSRNFSVDRDLVAKLRHEWDHAITLRLDANRQWSPHTAAAHLDQLYPFDLDYIEEPTCTSSLSELDNCPIPLALDESLRDTHQDTVASLARRGAIHVLILKPMVLGGILPTLEWANLARELTLDVVVTHLFDGPVAWTATAELALALGCHRPCGLDTHPALAAWPNITPFPLGLPTIDPHDRAGLGIDSRELERQLP